MKTITIFCTVIFIIMTMDACSGGKMEQKIITYSSLKDIPDQRWEELSEKKIYFGHQSVGFNIIDGIKDLMAENSKIKLNIVETESHEEFKNGIFGHSKVGENTKPQKKIEHFSAILNQGIGKKVDIAALKFCYVDINQDSDVQKIFDDYTTKVKEIKKKYPDLIIVHFTVPLKESKTTWKTFLKKLIGLKNIWEYGDNINRNKYNQLLIQEYKNKEPIFDIAKFESTKPDGSRQVFKFNGEENYSVVPEYTDDGGHLNELGRKKIAEQFILFIANLI